MGAIALLWIGWFVRREPGPWAAMDLGLVWGFSLVTLLLLSLAWNQIEVRVGPQGVDRQIGPLPVMEGSKRYARSEIESVHYWQESVPARRLDQSRSKPVFKAGIRRKGGQVGEVVGGFTTEQEAMQAAELVAKRLGLTATRMDRASEPVSWRGVLFLLAILCSSIIVARLASFIAALVQEF